MKAKMANSEKIGISEENVQGEKFGKAKTKKQHLKNKGRFVEKVNGKLEKKVKNKHRFSFENR